MADPNGNQATTNLVECSVSELAFALKRTVEEAYGLVRLRGEISGFRGQHASGHAYFALKDEKAAIEAVIWKSTFARLKFKPEQGLEVIVRGRLTTYPASRNIRSSSTIWSPPASARSWRCSSSGNASSPPKACSTRIASCRCPIYRASSVW